MRSLLLAGLVLLAPQLARAQAQQFNVGDHVTIGSTGETGTVIAVGQPMTNSGVSIRVHLDRLGAGFPDVGSWYDSVTSRVTPNDGGQPPANGAPPQAAPQLPTPQAAIAPAPPQAGGGGGGAFNVGDHVTIGSTGDTGTIIAVGGPQANGGTLVKIHLDKLPPGFPDQGSWYDTAQSRVTR